MESVAGPCLALEARRRSSGRSGAQVRAWKSHQGGFLEGSTLNQDGRASDAQRTSQPVLAMDGWVERQGSVEADEGLGHFDVVDSGIEDQRGLLRILVVAHLAVRWERQQLMQTLEDFGFEAPGRICNLQLVAGADRNANRRSVHDPGMEIRRFRIRLLEVARVLGFHVAEEVDCKNRYWRQAGCAHR